MVARALRNRLRRWRYGDEDQRPELWQRFEAEVSVRAGPGLELVDNAILYALQREPPSDVRGLVRRIERRRQALLDSESTLSIHMAGWPASRTTEVLVGPTCAKISKDPSWGLWLLYLVRVSGARRVLEMGSAFGLSSSYLAAGLAPDDDKAKIVTLDGCPAYEKLAQQTWTEVGVADRVELVDGHFDDTLASTAQRLGPLDLVFIDGDHQEAPTRAYFETLRPHLAWNALVVFDDIRWNTGMTRAWEDLRRLGSWVDLGSVGVLQLASAR